MAEVEDEDLLSTSIGMAGIEDKDFASVVGKMEVGDGGVASVAGGLVGEKDFSSGVSLAGVEDTGTSGSWICSALLGTCEKEAERQTRVTLHMTTTNSRCAVPT